MSPGPRFSGPAKQIFPFTTKRQKAGQKGKPLALFGNEQLQLVTFLNRHQPCSTLSIF
jgi:hypothetical protein